MRSLERAGRGPRSLNCVRVVPAPAWITVLLLAERSRTQSESAAFVPYDRVPLAAPLPPLRVPKNR